MIEWQIVCYLEKTFFQAQPLASGVATYLGYT